MKRTLLALALSATAALAQDASALRLKAIKNAPFSAQVQTETTQALPDWNRMTRTTSATLARDSEGRTRREQTGTGIVFIYDPILGLASVIDTRARTVRQFAIPSDETKSTPPPGAVTLGWDILEGLPVEGTRLTRQIAAGESGNEKSIEVTSETWYSADLQTLVMSKTLDPRIGETVFKLTDIQRGEPERSLFEVPADYTVRERPSGFESPFGKFKNE
jgi:hypothetical protein